MDVIWLAVIVAAVVRFAIGAVWYTALFGKQWRALQGIPEGSQATGFAQALVVGFITDLVTAYILARFVIHYGVPSIGEGILVGVLAWIGFMLTVGVGSVFYERKPWMLVVINQGYLLVGLAVMGAILGWWHEPAAVAAATPAPA